MKLTRQRSAQEMDVSTAMTKGRISKPHTRGLLSALLLAVGYYFGAKIGFALPFGPAFAPILWPLNAVLLAGLLMSQPQSWWLILLVIFSSHLATQLDNGVPLWIVLGWFAVNCCEAILGAVWVRGILKQRMHFDSVRNVIAFFLCCVVVFPSVSSLLDITLVKVLDWGTSGFWQLWRLRFFSDAVAMLIFVPACLTWNACTPPAKRKESFLRQREGKFLTLALLGIGGVIFIFGFGPAGFVPLLLYAPLPILLWAAVRFEPFITSISFLFFAFLSVWGTFRGQRLVLESSYFEQTYSLQLFLISVSVPLFLLSAAMQERRKLLETLRRREEKWNLALAERTTELNRTRDELKCAAEERQKAVEAERLTEARFSHVFRHSPDAMSISVGIQGRILDVNDRWQILFGHGRAKAIGSTPQQLNLYASEKDLATVLDRHMEGGFIRDVEVDMRDREGRTRHVVFSGGEIDAGDKSGFITILRDVTEQRQAEHEAQKQREQLAHLTRVVVLGELSGALAHELNQPLAAILTNAQAARRFMNHQPVDLREIREILDDIVDEDKRAGEVIRRLRALFMKGEPKMQPLDINELVRDALELTHSDLIGRKVPVILQFGSNLGMVQGDRVQLQQVLLNLIVNACEAMSGRPPGTRRLSLSTDTDMDGNVRITVTDTGPGIAPDVIDKVFESFFTTKAHGMGFGLSISRAIISEHGGCIDAANNPCGGATFRITIPARVGVLS